MSKFEIDLAWAIAPQLATELAWDDKVVYGMRVHSCRYRVLQKFSGLADHAVVHQPIDGGDLGKRLRKWGPG